MKEGWALLLRNELQSPNTELKVSDKFTDEIVLVCCRRSSRNWPRKLQGVPIAFARLPD